MTKPEPIFPTPMIRDPQDAQRPIALDDARFAIRLYQHGRHWHATITQGIGILGEAGSTTYRSRHRHRTVHKAMRTISRRIADQHLDHTTICITDRREGGT